MKPVLHMGTPPPGVLPILPAGNSSSINTMGRMAGCLADPQPNWEGKVRRHHQGKMQKTKTSGYGAGGG